MAFAAATVQTSTNRSLFVDLKPGRLQIHKKGPVLFELILDETYEEIRNENR